MILNIFICNSTTWCLTEINGKSLKISSDECIIHKGKEDVQQMLTNGFPLR